MIYRGKFPAENYTQTRPADLPLKGNRLSFFPWREARVVRIRPKYARRNSYRGEIVSIFTSYKSSSPLRGRGALRSYRFDLALSGFC